MEIGKEAQRAYRLPLERLTPRERDVVRLLATGMQPKAIARQLSVTHSTVKTHIGHVVNKTGTEGTFDLAVKVAAGKVAIDDEP